ncbi:MAG: hypothetical protein ACRD0I_02445 [Acidimicrobiales bacterium]
MAQVEIAGERELGRPDIAGAGAQSTYATPTWSRPETVVRRILFIRPIPSGVDDDDAHRIFSTSILLSAFRCLLGYVVLPVLTPAIGAAAGVGPYVGIPIAVVALVFDVIGIRRFWLAEHKWRWGVSVIYLAVMALVATLLGADINHLV